MIAEQPPRDSYLASHYVDRRRRLETRRVYYDDGRVEAFDGREWWQVCRFSPDQVERARQAVRASGLPGAEDLPAGKAHDTAALTYSWSLDGQAGSVTNGAYPAREHAAFRALEERLDALEAEALGQ